MVFRHFCDSHFDLQFFFLFLSIRARKLGCLTTTTCMPCFALPTRETFSLNFASNFSSWKDTQDPAACNTNPDVYKKYTRDPERTPFQWDGTKNAGFSNGAKTWLPVNPNYGDLNLQKEKAAAKSHFKFYQQLMELRKIDTFQFGDLKVLALNKRVLAYVRDLLDKDTYVVLINIGANDEHVSLKAFATLRDKLKVVAAAPASDYEVG